MIRPDGSRERGRRAGRRETGDVRDGAQLETRDRAAGRGWERTSPFSLLPRGTGHDRGEEGVREVVRGLSWRWRRRRRAGGIPHAAPAARFHRRDLQDPHDRERPAAHGPGCPAVDRRRPPRYGHACLEGPTLGARAARRARLPQDLLGLLPGHEPAHRAPHVLERAGWRDERRGAAGGAAVLRLDRVLEVPRQGGAGGRPLRAHAQDGPRRADLRCGPAPELALPGRRERGGDLPAAPHRARRHAHAVVLGPDRPEVPDRRATVAGGPVRAEPVAGAGTRGARRDPRPAPAGRATSLALRLEWDDRSQSPDTAWLEFQRRVLDHLVSDDSVAARADLQPDEMAVQFPRSIPAGMERPYFLMGTATDPVYQWRWTSAPRQAAAGL